MIHNKEDLLKVYNLINRFGWTPVKVISVRLYPGQPLHTVYDILKSLVKLGVVVKEQGSYFSVEGGVEIIEAASLTNNEQIVQVVDKVKRGELESDVAFNLVLRLI